MPIAIKITKVTPIPNFPLPERKTTGSAGVDLQAAIASPITLEPGDSKLIPGGIAIALPEGYEAQVRPRSGLAQSFTSPTTIRTSSSREKSTVGSAVTC